MTTTDRTEDRVYAGAAGLALGIAGERRQQFIVLPARGLRAAHMLSFMKPSPAFSKALGDRKSVV